MCPAARLWSCRIRSLNAGAKRCTYSAKYKAAILAEYEQLDKQGKGELLRREGLYTSLISAWRDQRDRGVRRPWRQRRAVGERTHASASSTGCGTENDKLSERLETAERVIEVQGKLSALLEDLAAEGATTEPNASDPKRKR
ncbi:MAG: hypothetical protein U5R31_04735 [Acidimicrobiia bacterium]|nr:hypothetical protein [Acidimicrobiia bacterium]